MSDSDATPAAPASGAATTPTPLQPTKGESEATRTVDRASAESFPASDAPSWTPVVAPRAPAELTEEEAAGWQPTGSSVHERAMNWAQHATDLLDAARFGAYAVAHLSEDVQFAASSTCQLSGRRAVREWLEQLRSTAGRSAHRITAVTADDDAIVVEAEVTYVTADGRSSTIPEAMSYRLRGDRASRVQLYTTAPITPAPAVTTPDVTDEEGVV